MTNTPELCPPEASQDEIIAIYLDSSCHSRLSDEDVAKALNVTTDDVQRVRNDPSILATYRAWQADNARKSAEYLQDEARRHEEARRELRESSDINPTTWLPIYKAIALVAEIGTLEDEAWKKLKECIRYGNVKPRCKVGSKDVDFEPEWLNHIERMDNSGEFGEDYSLLIGQRKVGDFPVQAFFVRDMRVEQAEIEAMIARMNKAPRVQSEVSPPASASPIVTKTKPETSSPKPGPLKQDRNKLYAERVLQFQMDKGRAPTFAEDWENADSWGRTNNLTRDIVRDLRKFLEENKKSKGGRPSTETLAENLGG